MNLFVYGTLMWPAIVTAVIGRRMVSTPATLRGYARRRVKGECYPGLVSSAADSVEGVLLKGFTELDFELLDGFEGPEYDRIEVLIEGEAAQLYVVADSFRHILDTDTWSPDDLQPGDLMAFCEDSVGRRNGLA